MIDLRMRSAYIYFVFVNWISFYFRYSPASDTTKRNCSRNAFLFINRLDIVEVFFEKYINLYFNEVNHTTKAHGQKKKTATQMEKQKRE